MNSREDYRMGYLWQTDELICYDVINPTQYVFHEDTETCTPVYTEYDSQQIAFVRNLIAYVEEHGYIDDMSILLKPPFDRPMPFVRLYSAEDQKRIISIVNDINENATKLVG